METQIEEIRGALSQAAECLAGEGYSVETKLTKYERGGDLVIGVWLIATLSSHKSFPSAEMASKMAEALEVLSEHDFVVRQAQLSFRKSLLPNIYIYATKKVVEDEV